MSTRRFAIAASAFPIDVEAGGACAAKEAEVAWDQEGPQGLHGPQGPAGV